MGLIKMISGSVGTTFRDAVKDYFRCDGMTKDILAMPATKVMRDGTVNNASDRVITNGSVFDVAINQAALLIENGKVHDFIIATDESMTGQYRYDSTVEPSLLGGGLKDFVPTLKTMVGRFTAGGQSTNTMSLVYINLKEITENPIGIGKVAFIDKYLGTRLMLSAHGYYSFKIQNPVAFYENLVMDVNTRYDKHKILTQLKGELMPKVKRAMGMVAPLCEAGYQDIFIHDTDIANIINEEIQKEWLENRGILLVKVALNPELSEEDTQRVMDLENAKTLSNTQMGLGSLIHSQGQSMRDAANNTAGAMNGFIGMGMARQMGGIDVNALLQQQMQNEQQQRMMQQPAPQPVQQAPADAWKCSCGNMATGKFCSNCGSTKPVADTWQCSCGHMATGKFCSNCGSKKVEAVTACPSCGNPFPDPANPPRFCNNCGHKMF